MVYLSLPAKERDECSEIIKPLIGRAERMNQHYRIMGDKALSFNYRRDCTVKQLIADAI